VTTAEPAHQRLEPQAFLTLIVAAAVRDLRRYSSNGKSNGNGKTDSNLKDACLKSKSRRQLQIQRQRHRRGRGMPRPYKVKIMRFIKI
jgi:hypothetical protein